MRLYPPDDAGHLVRGRLVGGEAADLRLGGGPGLLVVVLPRDLEVAVPRRDDGAQPRDVVRQNLKDEAHVYMAGIGPKFCRNKIAPPSSPRADACFPFYYVEVFLLRSRPSAQ